MATRDDQRCEYGGYEDELGPAYESDPALLPRNPPRTAGSDEIDDEELSVVRRDSDPSDTGSDRSREDAVRRRRELRGSFEVVVLVLLAFLLALTLKTYVAEAYEIKGKSMQPTFWNEERVVVLKAFYGIERGDVVVFSSTEDPSKDLIKRVVGLPGETLEIRGGRVYVDGEPLSEEYGLESESGPGTRPQNKLRVPSGEFYVLGDNRPDSHDSRYFGPVPASTIKGKVIVRWWPFAEFRSF